ncbi:MAG: hypothetical protein WCE63_21850 [Acidobacteriaceae bacterium]
MNEISSKERLVLLAVERYESGISRTGLGLVTGLPMEVVQESIINLEVLGPIQQVLGGKTYYVSTPLASHPLFPCWKEWLGIFCEAVPRVIEGDTLGTMYASCGVVLLAAILGDTRDAESIASVTTFSVKFVMLVLGMAERQSLWFLDSAFELQQELCDHLHDLVEIERCLQDLSDDLWELCWSPDIEAELHKFRAGRQFGGAVGCWVEEEACGSKPGLLM